MTGTSTAPGSPGAWIRRLVRFSLGVIGLSVLFSLAWHARADLQHLARSARPVVLVAAVLAGVVLNVAQGVYFARLMSKNGSHSRSSDLVVAFLLAQPGKYVPGKIWGPLIQRASLGSASSLLGIGTSNLELALAVLVQMTCLGVACLSLSFPGVAIAAVTVAVTAGAALLRTDTLGELARRLPRLGAQLGVDTAFSRPSPLRLPSALVLSAGVMCVTMLASWLVLAAMGLGISPEDQLNVLGTMFIGFASSLLAFPVPVGLGVREAATAGIGSVTVPDISEKTLIAVALFARGWQLAVDALSLFIGLVAGYMRRNQ